MTVDFCFFLSHDAFDLTHIKNKTKRVGLEGDEVGSRSEGSEPVDHGRRKRKKEQGHCVRQLSGREVSIMQQKRRSRPCKQRKECV